MFGGLRSYSVGQMPRLSKSKLTVKTVKTVSTKRSIKVKGLLYPLLSGLECVKVRLRGSSVCYLSRLCLDIELLWCKSKFYKLWSNHEYTFRTNWARGSPIDLFPSSYPACLKIQASGFKKNRLNTIPNCWYSWRSLMWHFGQDQSWKQ